MLEIRDLTKRFGAKVAVDGLSFKASPGRVLGFLGPNGAGKTTTLRALLGLTLPTSGSAMVDSRPYRELGMRERLSLAGALLGDPRALVLDEPANGLDPQGIRWLHDFLRAQAGDGRTVLVCSRSRSTTSSEARRTSARCCRRPVSAA